MPACFQIYFLPFYFLTTSQPLLSTGFLLESTNGGKSGRLQKRQSEKAEYFSLCPAALMDVFRAADSPMWFQLLPNSLGTWFLVTDVVPSSLRITVASALADLWLLSPPLLASEIFQYLCNSFSVLSVSVGNFWSGWYFYDQTLIDTEHRGFCVADFLACKHLKGHHVILEFPGDLCKPPDFYIFKS